MPPAKKPVPVSPLIGLLMRYGPLFGLALVVILACVMYGNVFGGEIAGDDLTFHLAESNRMADCIHAGDWDMWNPSANAGFASAYYYQALPQLTPALLSVITGASVLFWFQVCVFLPLVLAPVAAYKALRVIGTSGWHALGGAFAIVVSASNNRWGFGADGTFSVGLYTQTWALAAFPLALAYAIRWVRDGGSLAPAVAWSGVVAVCHPFAGIAVGLAVTAGAAVVIAWAPAAAAIEAARGGVIARVTGFTRHLRDADDAPAPRLRIGAAAIRIPVFGALLLAAIASVWLPLIFDYAGFGGFPHRVWDEVGPGFVRLWHWFVSGQLLDCDRWAPRQMRVLTLLVPITLLFGRDRALVWLWSGAVVFALLLGLGPNLPRSTGDDLFPMVRFLGPLQICLSLAIGVGVVSIARALWRWSIKLGATWELPIQALAAGLGTAAIVLTAIPAVHIAHYRARNVTEYDYIHRDELRDLAHRLAALPEGRRQARWGTENHWANLLPYVDARVPATLQMGGAGLQSSPNYDFLWSESDPARIAWVFDAPYVTMTRTDDNADKLPDAEVVVQTEHYTVKRLPAPGLVSPVQIVAPPLPQGRFPARQAAIDWLRTDDALDDKLRPYDVLPGPSGPPDAQVLDAHRQDSPGDAPDIVAKVHVGKPTTFVVRESWHPRWRGYIDGREAPLRRVTPDFFAIDVPSGDHALAFRFDRPWWVWASWLMLILVPLAGWRLGPRLKKLAEPPPVDEIEKVF